MKRIDALATLDAAFGEVPLVVTCGATARELAVIADRPSHLSLLDSMGLTSAVGLGVALAHPGPVGVIDGDGSLLMGFQVLPTLATLAPSNLTIVVLDNHAHASAAGIPSQSASVSLARAARGVGLEVDEVGEPDALGDAVARRLRGGFALIVAEIEAGNAADVPWLLADPAVVAARFRDALTSQRERGGRGAARAEGAR